MIEFILNLQTVNENSIRILDNHNLLYEIRI